MDKDWPKVQVALDFMNLQRALKVAEASVSGGADWLEAGTPLIKSEGSEAIRQLKKKFPHCVIVADMKTMDVGSIEVEIAAKAGADVVCILGAADDETFKDALEAAKNYNVKLMADLIGIKEKAERARRLEEIGVDYVCVHVGIDQQMKGENPLVTLAEVVKAVTIPVATAGGINSETAPEVVKSGASIVVVGGAITKAEDVEKAAQTIKESISKGEGIKSELFKKYGQDELYDAFSKVSSANISDAMHRRGAMGPVKALLPEDGKVIGKAVTVRTMDGDWAKPVEAIDRAGKGEVLVISVSGCNQAVWGELASCSCVERGIEGAVIDGAARDVPGIRSAGFQLFAREFVPNAGDPKGFGEIGIEVECFGQRVRTGDWIIGDETGVVVVPKEKAVEIANRALDVLERENRVRQEIKDGGTLSSVLELLKWEKVG
jgi:3-hexulose-6-phosphate synthase/6-phospho-3-hexuloisomerase